MSLDSVVTLANAIFDNVTDCTIELRKNLSDGCFVVTCGSTDFFNWFSEFDNISILPYYDGFVAEVNYMCHKFVTYYHGVGDVDYFL